MKRILCMLALVAMLLSSLPLSVLAIERDDYENIAAQNYEQDTVLFSLDYSGGISISSGDVKRWNKYSHNKTTYGDGIRCTEAVNDPLDETNRVGKFFANSNAKLVKSYLDGRGGDFVVATDMMIPTPAEGSYPTGLTVQMGNAVLLTLTYDAASSRYSWTVGEQMGYLRTGAWFRLTLYCAPSTDEGAAAGDTVGTMFLSGALENEDGASLTCVKATDLAFNNSTAQMTIQTVVPSGSVSGFYLDDTVYYLAGDVCAASVIPTLYGDPAGNLDLAGKVTVKFNHELDLTTFDLSKVRLYTTDETVTVPYTSLAFDPTRSDTLIYDFSQHPLSTYTDYYIAFPEGVRDVCGLEMTETVVSFTTKGEKDSRPAPLPLVTPPEGGYVMPDEYNTGYRCAEEELVPFLEKYPLFGSTQVIVTEELARAYNYEFSGFILSGTIKITATSPVYFHDFYLWGDGLYGFQNSGSPRVTLAWGEIENCRSAAVIGNNITMSHLFIHDTKADHIKGCAGQIIESCYVRDGGTRNPGAHADVIQISCSTASVTDNIVIVGNRLDIPSMAYDHVANACIFIKPEKSGGNLSQGYSNIQVSYNWLNGGGYTTYILNNDMPAGRVNYVTYTHNILGVGHQFAKYTSDVAVGPEALTYEDNEYAATLSAGSVVFYDKDGGRIFDVADLSGSGKVLVNFANYTALARTYGVEVALVDGDGNTVSTFSADGSLVRNMGAKEYLVASNLRDVLDEDGNVVLNPENGSVIRELIEKPDLPRNVACEIDLAGLPADLTGYSLEVRIYDTTGGSELIRSSVLAENVEENTLLPKPAYHTVTFKGQDGQVLKTEQVLAGAAATAPTAPTVAGYEFAGWSADFSAVSSDLTVLATYVAVYQVTFLGRDGQTLKTEAVRAGGAATAPTAPSVAGYRFTGWDVDFSCVNSNLTVTAQYAPIPTYTVTFLGKDGAVLATQTVLEGQSATAPTAPQVDGYTFVGWSGSFFAVTSDLTVTARYEPIPVYVPSAEMLAFRGAVATAESATGSLAARRAALLAAAEAYLAVPTAERAQGQTEYETLSALADALSAALSAANGEAAVAGEIAHSLGRLGDNR